MELPYAEKINYWKTGKSSPESWIVKAAAQIEKLGGNIVMHGFGNDPTVDRQAYVMVFEIEGDPFKAIWPVLPQEYMGGELAAKRQAATLLYHDIKNKCLNALIKGHRRAFFEYIMLPNGQTAGDMSDDNMVEYLPKLLTNIDKKLLE